MCFETIRLCLMLPISTFVADERKNCTGDLFEVFRLLCFHTALDEKNVFVLV